MKTWKEFLVEKSDGKTPYTTPTRPKTPSVIATITQIA